MKMLQDVTDWFKAEILGDQSLQQERKKLKSQKDFENALDEGKKVQYDGVELDIFNEDGTILKEWIQDVA